MEFIDPNKVFGLGTGSTVNYLLKEIHESYVSKGQSINAVSTSEETSSLARRLGINIVDLDQVNELDVVIDGADEVDPDFRSYIREVATQQGVGGPLPPRLKPRLVGYGTKALAVAVDCSRRGSLRCRDCIMIW